MVGRHQNILARGLNFDVVTTSPINLLLGSGQAIGEETQEITLFDDIKVPIQPGDVVGRLIYSIDGVNYLEVDLTVAEEVGRTSFISLLTHTFGQLFFGGH